MLKNRRNKLHLKIYSHRKLLFELYFLFSLYFWWSKRSHKDFFQKNLSISSFWTAVWMGCIETFCGFSFTQIWRSDTNCCCLHRAAIRHTDSIPNDSSVVLWDYISQPEPFILPSGSTNMAVLLLFVTVLHLVTLAMLFIATMEKVSRNALLWKMSYP